MEISYKYAVQKMCIFLMVGILLAGCGGSPQSV